MSMRPIPIRQVAATTISPNDDNTWTEVAPSAAGMKADRLEQVTDWLASRLRDRHFGAQLVVLRGGRVVLDRSVGATNRDHARVTPGDRFVVYSLGKPFAALCVHLLAERGLLTLDKPVSVYWPEYGQHGKQGVTVRQVLQHRTGSPSRELVAVYLSNKSVPDPIGFAQLLDLSDLILDACE